MCDQLQQKFKYSDPPAIHQTWEKGQACAAFYNKDETWHRASVVKIEPDKVQVNTHCLYFGNTMVILTWFSNYLKRYYCLWLNICSCMRTGIWWTVCEFIILLSYYQNTYHSFEGALKSVLPDSSYLFCACLQIHFIDYGNHEWVGYDQLRADIEEFTNIPQQTFLCTLHDIRPVCTSWQVIQLTLVKV